MSGPAIVTSRIWPASASVSNWLNVMSLLGAFWAGLWNRVTSARTSRKMITQRAKFRKFGFIAFPSTAARPESSESNPTVPNGHLSAPGTIAK